MATPGPKELQQRALGEQKRARVFASQKAKVKNTTAKSKRAKVVKRGRSSR